MSANLDRRVLDALARGESHAREVFFDHFYDRVYNYLAHTVRNEHLAEDLTHDVFLKLNAALASIDPARDPAGWVFTVAANVVRDHWRRSHTRAAQRSTELSEVVERPAMDATTIDESMIAAEDHARIHRAMGTLSANDREILMLRNWAELDGPALASALGIAPEAIRQRWSRAVRRLGDAYRALESAEGGAS